MWSTWDHQFSKYAEYVTSPHGHQELFNHGIGDQLAQTLLVLYFTVLNSPGEDTTCGGEAFPARTLRYF